MKDRFWFVYYWTMIAYAGLGLFVFVISLLLFHDRTMESGLKCDVNMYSDACEQGNNVPDIIFDINEYVFFDFIDYVNEDGKSRITGFYDDSFIKRGISVVRYIDFNNGYPLLLILGLTLIRWISIGKHIWQRPESS